MQVTIEKYDNRHFFVKVPFEGKDLFKEAFKAYFDWATKTWVIHEEFLPYVLQKIGENNVHITEKARNEFYAFSKILEIKKKKDVELPKVPFSDKLYPYQRIGVQFISSGTGKILADEMGLGKTVQAIAALANMGAEHALVVSPNPLKISWKREFEKWSDFDVSVAAGTQSKRIKAISKDSGIVIINYEMLLSEKYREILSQKHFDAIIADESTFLKNRKAKRTKYFEELHADHKIFLTGTPVTKTPADLFAPLHILYPFIYPSYWPFVRKYCFVDEVNLGSGRKFYKVYGVQNEEELKAELDGILIRRTKKEVAEFLPEIIEENVILDRNDMPEEQRILYDKAEQDLIAATESKDRNSILKNIVYLQEILETPLNFGVDAESVKILALKQIIDTYLDQSRSFIVWTQFVATAHVVFKVMQKIMGVSNVGIITGGQKDKDKVKDQFVSGKIQGLVITLKTGKFGFNLTVPDKEVVSIFVSKSFDFEEMEQAKRRVLRLTTTKSPTIISIGVSGTIDDSIEESLSNKKNIFDVLFSKQSKK